MLYTTARLTFITALLTLVACAGVPFDYPKAVSHAMPPSPATRLGEVDANWEKTHGKLSGVIGLPDGVDALGARLRMMELAEHTIDAQYFIIKNDQAGALFTGKMLRAADRGVRVRLLVDDIFSPGVDQAFTLLNTHPNVQVRLFNPLSRQSFRFWSYLVDFKRINRRMHNKSFTVDNALTIVGGRNIGEEYFELDQDVEFDDYEVLAMGPAVDEVSAGFDKFWNSELSVPIEAFDLKVDPEKLDKWRAYIEDQINAGSAGIYSQAMNSSLLIDIKAGKKEPIPAMVTMVTDSPEKLQNAIGDIELAKLARETGRRFRAAKSEIVIVTPYFVPLDRGATFIEELLAKNIRVVIVTNSLASTNHVAVYSGYRRYRERLLRAGAEFYEIRAQREGGENSWGHNPELVTLHSKATLIDRETIFVGSLNFDPRSLMINSEMGLFIESDYAGAGLASAIFAGIDRIAYKVDLDEQGELRWTYQYGDQHEVTNRSPQTSWGRRFMVGFYGLLPIEK
ncbi:MAG: phospholipase D family protein, partial [Halioglobus sp.]